MVWVVVEEAALGGGDLGFKDGALAGAHQDRPGVGLRAQQFVPAHALDEVAPPAGQAAHLLGVPVQVQALAAAQADQQMGACEGQYGGDTCLLWLCSMVVSGDVLFRSTWKVVH